MLALYFSNQGLRILFVLFNNFSFLIKLLEFYFYCTFYLTIILYIKLLEFYLQFTVVYVTIIR